MSDKTDRETIIKKSAELLRAGARMLPEQCPSCGSPLFQLKTGETVCPVHGKVYIIRKEEEVVQVSLDSALMRLEDKALKRISLLLNEIENLGETPSVAELRLLKIIEEWLKIVHTSRKIKTLR